MAAVEMKLVLIFALLIYAKCTSTSGQKNVCATPGNPITINVHGKEGIKGEKGEKGDSGNGEKGNSSTPCKCNLQDPNKPSAHIEALNRVYTTYQASQVIKDWSASAPHSHLAGGMKYHDGKLTVPIPGRYYIYAQLYYYIKHGVVNIRVNNNAIITTQPPTAGKDHGTLYAGGVFYLKAGDIITLAVLKTSRTTGIFMYSIHSFFGAFMI